MNTIGGVALVLFGRLPRVGEKVFFADYEITVKEVSGMRITKVRVSYGSTREEQEGAPEQPLEMESVGAEVVSEDSPADQEQETLDEYEDDLLRETKDEPSESPQGDEEESDGTPSARAASVAN